MATFLMTASQIAAFQMATSQKDASWIVGPKMAASWMVASQKLVIFTDFEIVKKFSISLDDFERVKNLVYILLSLNK